MNLIRLSPLTLQFLFFALLWLLVLLLAFVFLGARLAAALRARASASAAPGALGSGAAAVMAASSGAAGTAAASAGADAAWEITVISPPADGAPARRERIVLTSTRITIGRGTAADLKLNDEFSSSLHAALVQDSVQLTLEDLNSTNGTFLNDLPVTAIRPLQPGDVIRIGKTELHVSRS